MNADSRIRGIRGIADSRFSRVSRVKNTNCALSAEQFLEPLLSGKVLFVSAKLPPDSNRCIGTQLHAALYVNKRGNKKTLQTIHKPYILLFVSLIIRMLRNVQFVLQTIHKLYTNYTLKRSKPYTKRSANPTWQRSVNPTQNGAQFYLGAHLSKI